MQAKQTPGMYGEQIKEVFCGSLFFLNNPRGTGFGYSNYAFLRVYVSPPSDSLSITLLEFSQTVV